MGERRLSLETRSTAVSNTQGLDLGKYMDFFIFRGDVNSAKEELLDFEV